LPSRTVHRWTNRAWTSLPLFDVALQCPATKTWSSVVAVERPGARGERVQLRCDPPEEVPPDALPAMVDAAGHAGRDVPPSYPKRTDMSDSAYVVLVRRLYDSGMAPEVTAEIIAPGLVSG